MNSFIRSLVIAGVSVSVFAFAAVAKDAIESETLKPIAGTKTIPGDKIAPVEEEVSIEEQAAVLCESVQVMSTQAGPDYQPGIDAYGRPVTPANGGTAYDLPERIDIPVAINIAQYMNVSPDLALDTAANVGTISLMRDGRVMMNGKDISSNIHAYCGTSKQ